MVIELKRPDCAKKIEPGKIFSEDREAGDSSGCGCTTEGILEGLAIISQRPEILSLEKSLLKPAPDNDKG